MMEIKICVGSSCHLKGSHDIVELFNKALKDYNLEAQISLVGSFCTGKCNRDGVTIQVGDTVHTGVTPANFKEFFESNVLSEFTNERI